MKVSFRNAAIGLACCGLGFQAAAQTPAPSEAPAPAATAQAGQAAAAEARTAAGSVTGTQENGVFVFKGIRYGADTGGENRFDAPKPPEAWTDPAAATAYGARCPGADYPPILMAEEGEGLDAGPASEDCLFLNVWTAGLDDAKRPVMVWLHGGGYTSGSGGSVRYDGTNLAAKRDVVVLTLNHRLGPLGFLDLSGVEGAPAQSGNAGMLDIVQALAWVRDNIAAFGGDPDNVTVFGESGGGSKATTLLAMPAAEGLVDKAIAQSGVNLRPVTAEAAAGASATLREALKAGDLAALRAASVDDILKNGGGNWGPVAGADLPAGPFAAEGGWGRNVPLMVGSNLTEATFFNATPTGALSDEELATFLTEGMFTQVPADRVEALVAAYRAALPDMDATMLGQVIASDAWMTGQVVKAADARAASGAPAWVYLFAQPQGAREGLNVPHTAEIAYAFDNLDLSTALVGTPDDDDRRLAEQMSKAWTSFARTGDPNAEGLPEWRPYKADDKAVMVFDSAPHLVVDPYGARLTALDAAKTK